MYWHVLASRKALSKIQGEYLVLIQELFSIFLLIVHAKNKILMPINCSYFYYLRLHVAVPKNHRKHLPLELL